VCIQAAFLLFIFNNANAINFYIVYKTVALKLLRERILLLQIYIHKFATKMFCEQKLESWKLENWILFIYIEENSMTEHSSILDKDLVMNSGQIGNILYIPFP